MILSYLEALRVAEALVGKQLVQLIPSLDPVTLVSVLGAKDLGDIGKVPGLDVVVASIPSMDVSLDGVALVADHKAMSCQHRVFQKCLGLSLNNLHNWLELVPQHRAQLLHCQLDTTITDE